MSLIDEIYGCAPEAGGKEHRKRSDARICRPFSFYSRLSAHLMLKDAKAMIIASMDLRCPIAMTAAGEVAGA
jgi:hypothetical protein